jgi:hypothetical protein
VDIFKFLDNDADDEVSDQELEDLRRIEHKGEDEIS